MESVKRVIPCFEYVSLFPNCHKPSLPKLILFRAAGLATGCQVSIKHEAGSTFDLRQNTALGGSFISSHVIFAHWPIFLAMEGGEVANIVLNKYGAIDYEWGIKSASTDFVSSLFSLLSKSFYS
jgi:hypothetical protein